MEAYQQRVIDEKFDLDKKIEKLRDFITSEMFGELSFFEQRRLRRQAAIMGLYSDVLDERIVGFCKFHEDTPMVGGSVVDKPPSQFYQPTPHLRWVRNETTDVLVQRWVSSVAGEVDVWCALQTME
jgi:hypothetical protein